MKLLVLVGSSRPGSFNRQLAAVALSHVPADIEVEHFDRLGELPFYEEHVDAKGGLPALVKEFRDRVRAADAILVVTPEYNGAPPAALKNAIDIASRPRDNASIAGKPVGVIAATGSMGGAQSARDVMIVALTRAQAKPIETTVGIPAAYEAFADGQLVNGELADEVKTLVESLVGAPALV